MRDFYLQIVREKHLLIKKDSKKLIVMPIMMLKDLRINWHSSLVKSLH